ncbi:phage major capsid protein [Rickettsia endosymbiont of Halotydeus destructor]|uniref:phage major capsid protein n=1 Tax=Rickettsia endosymbiont of Halotydeus destructor TaxID=2996754 RepID=UPI003BAFAECB
MKKIIYSSQTFQNMIIKSSTNNEVVISGYASVYNVTDHHNDLIIKGAFASACHNNVRFLWQHDSKKPIGIITHLSEDDYGLKMEAVINNKVKAGSEAIELVKQGAIDGLSIGFYVKMSNYNESKQRVITEAELVEVSIVTFPANHNAKILYITKQADNMEQDIITKDVITDQINRLQEKMHNMHNFLERPHGLNIEDNEYKTAFIDYVRKGEESAFIRKSSLNSNIEEGGVLILQTLYNSIISEINARSPMRQIASIETISTNALDVISENGKFTSGWVGEVDLREETPSAKLKQQRIFVHELYAQPKASQALLDDTTIRVENWLTERLRDSFVKMENDAFINGDGVKKPKGILSPDNSKIEKIKMGNKIEPEKLLDFINSLKEEYLANATLLMNRVTLSEIQKLKDNNGRFIWQQSLSESFKQTIFGVPVICCSDMKAIGKDNCAIAIGDFKAGYKIVDRSGINIMRDPYTEKPFVKFYAVKRVGGDVVNPEAIKLGLFG